MIVKDGYVVAFDINENPDILKTRPTAKDGYMYRLREDLTWELYELPIVEEETTYTAEQLAEMTTAELKAICTELNIPTSMVKQNMIDLILGKQNSLTD